MEYLDEIKSYIDPDGLIGKDKNPSGIRTGGNQILETAFACDLIMQYPLTPESQAVWMGLKDAVLRCKSENGLYDKNPGRPDQITFDCLIGAAHICEQTAKVITDFGRKNHWIMSNTGKIYFTAISRPQYIAYYKICAGEKPNMFEMGLLYLDLMFIAKDPSGLRLQYLICDRIKEYSKRGDYFYNRLLNHIHANYGSLAGLHKAYYETEDHFNAKFVRG